MLRRALVTFVIRRWLPWALGLALPGLVAACGSPVCHAVACDDGFYISVSSTGTPKQGTYSLVVVTDGVTTTCTMTRAEERCSDRVRMSFSGDELAQIVVGVSASESVKIVSAPVKVAVYRDGVELGSKSFMPVYAAAYWNGPECEPTCTRARDTFVFAH